MGRGTQFPPPAMNLETGKPLEGFCESQGTHWRADCGFMIMDQLQVPKHLALGDYVLSFRWDCEQTPQVWTTCANILVTEAQQTPCVGVRNTAPRFPRSSLVSTSMLECALCVFCRVLVIQRSRGARISANFFFWLQC